MQIRGGLSNISPVASVVMSWILFSHGHSERFFIFFLIYYLIDFIFVFCGEDSGLNKREGIMTSSKGFSWVSKLLLLATRHIEAWVSELAVSATLPLVFCIFICSLHKRIASLVRIHIVPRRHISLLFCLPFLLLFSSFSSYTPFSPSSPFSSSFFSFHPLLFL